MSQEARLHEIGKVYNYSGENSGNNITGANIKIQNQRKNQQAKDVTKRSATGGTGNITTPHM